MQHEPKLYAAEGPITGHEGKYTVASVGCTCGWNSDGKSYNKEGDWAAHLQCEFHHKEKHFCSECSREMTEPYTKALEEIADKLLSAVEVRNVPFGKKVYFLGYSMQGNSRSAQAVKRAEKFKQELAKILGVSAG